MTPARWDPACYGTFRRERAQPFFDLVGLIEPRSGMRVADLGCGTGELTADLHRRLAAGETLGVDRDEAMLERAAEHAGGGVRFERADVDEVVRRPEFRGVFDLVLSNAALHWIPDHEELMGQLMGCLADGGQLAFQIPANHDHPAHLAADEVAREEPFASALDGYQRGVPVFDIRRYAEILHGLGLRPPVAQVRVYLHELTSRADVLAWLRGSLLTAYESRLAPELFAAFSAKLRDRLAERLPNDEPYLFSYKRILVWGVKAA